MITSISSVSSKQQRRTIGAQKRPLGSQQLNSVRHVKVNWRNISSLVPQDEILLLAKNDKRDN